MSIPLLINNIDFNKINISNIKDISQNRKNLYLNYLTDNFIIQLPELVHNNQIEDYKEYYQIKINLECKNSEKTDRVVKLFTHLDDYFKELMNSNKEKFFNTKKIKYKSIIRNNNDVKYIKLKILKSNIDSHNINISCNNEKITIKELNEKCYLKFLLNINAIWINNDSFGIYIRPIGIKKTYNNQKQINFIPDSDNQCNNTILDSNIDTSINTICQTKNLNNVQTEKVLISSNNNTESKINNNKTSSITISSYQNDDNDMTTINFSTLDNINEEYDNEATSNSS
tara:strand:+ start:11781 stop:12635 length:855 start_codon:yes stop_codon:yes gene_type:complete